VEKINKKTGIRDAATFCRWARIFVNINDVFMYDSSRN